MAGAQKQLGRLDVKSTGCFVETAVVCARSALEEKSNKLGITRLGRKKQGGSTQDVSA